jgi:hypothetical protein
LKTNAADPKPARSSLSGAKRPAGSRITAIGMWAFLATKLSSTNANGRSMPAVIVADL